MTKINTTKAKATEKPKATTKSRATEKPKATTKSKATEKPKVTTNSKTKNVAAKKDENKINVNIPDFANVMEIKDFCVSNSLNKIDGYILVSKSKKTDFIKWVKNNIHLATPSNTNNSPNPHSPSSGIGELEFSIRKAKDSIGNSEDGKIENSQNNKSIYNEVSVDTPPLKTSDNTNEPPTALSGMKDAMNYGKEQILNNESEVNDNKKNIAQLKNYCLSINEHIVSSPKVRFHKNFSQNDLDDTISSCNKDYTYNKKADGNGVFLIVNDAYGNEARVPEHGYLPIT